MKTIVVGSKNKAKVAAVARGANAYWEQATVTGHDVESGVPAQPIGLEQTTQGAVNRAKASYALAADSSTTLGVGLEGGVMEMAGRWVLFGVVAVYDGVRESAVTTMATPLPDAWAEALKNGEELGPYIAAKFSDYNRNIGAMPFLTNNVITREDVFTEAVKGALAPWVNPAAFEETTIQAKAA